MSAHKPGETWRCTCGEALIGAKTKTAKVAPIVFNPVENGNVLLFRGRDGVLECRTLASAVRATLLLEGVPLRLNHFADCPDRERFRRDEAA